MEFAPTSRKYGTSYMTIVFALGFESLGDVGVDRRDIMASAGPPPLDEERRWCAIPDVRRAADDSCLGVTELRRPTTLSGVSARVGDGVPQEASTEQAAGDAPAACSPVEQRGGEPASGFSRRRGLQ